MLLKGGMAEKQHKSSPDTHAAHSSVMVWAICPSARALERS
jgi:hypothetical protein